MLKSIKKFFTMSSLKKILTGNQFSTVEEYWIHRYYELNKEIMENPHNCKEKINERDGIRLAMFGA